MEPPLQTTREPPAKTASGSRYSIHGNALASQPREWWEKLPPQVKKRNATKKAGQDFEFNLPEHLPSKYGRI
ncbi:hypothetical protein ESCO_004010 [Escovopsis weberi]|uniref:Uncharacterized protein n=1 Tax=Escovopsis weberi TaxID=150374 RepID=A0A0M8NA71_ESCWE|nr:hypothetical protein ESCO_004010 [Escovopsis weberi]